DAQAAFSRTSEAGRSTTAPLWQAFLRRGGRRYTFHASLNGNDPNFHAAAGFVGRQGVVFGDVLNQLALYGKPGAFVEKWTGDVQVQATWNYRDFRGARHAIERKLHFNSNFFFHGGWHTTTSVLFERYNFDPSIYAGYGILDGTAVRPFTGPTLPNLDYLVALDSPQIHGFAGSVFVIWGR